MLGINRFMWLKNLVDWSSQLDFIIRMMMMMILVLHFQKVDSADPAAPEKAKPAGWVEQTFRPVRDENRCSCRSSPAPLLYRCIGKQYITSKHYKCCSCLYDWICSSSVIFNQRKIIYIYFFFTGMKVKRNRIFINSILNIIYI